MRRNPLLTASAVGAGAAVATLAYMVVAGSDMALGFIVVLALFVGLAAGVATALVFWFIEVANRRGQ